MMQGFFVGRQDTPYFLRSDGLERANAPLEAAEHLPHHNTMSGLRR